MTVSPPAQSHTRRLLFEQLGQLLVVASGFVDRLLLTALILRSWNVSTFEVWSACIAVSAMVSLFELGFNMYFNNQLMIEMERGRREVLRATYATGNGLFALCGLLGFVVTVGAIFVADPLGSSSDSSAVVAAIVLCAANSARIALCAVNALYRANREYARFAIIQGVGELSRITLVGAVVALGGHLVGASLASALATTVVSVAFVLIDTRRRYFPNAYLIGMPGAGAIREIAGQSTLYMAQAVPIMLYTSLPVILLQKMELAPGLVASFVLVRTLSNVARAPLQSVGIVFGQETGRRLAIQDLEGARTVTVNAGRLFSVVSGTLSGLLLAGGSFLTRLWTGRVELYDESLMWTATLPMIMTPIAVLIHNVLTSHQAPLLPALARWMQILVTVGAWSTAILADPTERMMLALSIGEILGFAPIAYYASAQLMPGLGLRFHARCLAMVAATALFSAGVTHLLLQIVDPRGGIMALATLLLIGAVLGPAMLFAGFDRDGLRNLLVQFGDLAGARFGSERRPRERSE